MILSSSTPFACAEEKERNTNLPVINIKADGFEALYNTNDKETILQGTIEMFDEENQLCFSEPCGISLSGKASLNMVRHKSLKIDFGEEYGGNKSIDYDLFDTGETDYRSLILRAGTDAEYRIFNEVIWQDLALEMSDNIFTQHSRFCIAFINGSYYGLFIIKENIGPRSYATWKGVSKSSVQSFNPSKVKEQDYTDVFCSFVNNNDMSITDNYEKACSMVDMDNLVDYLIVEAVSGNLDLYYNIRVFRSDENDNKWQYALFDLDSAMNKEFYNMAWNNLYEGIYGNPNCLGQLLQSLLKNEDFRAKLISRYAEVYHDYLGNEKIIEKIEYYETLLSDDVDESFDRWNNDADIWRAEIEDLKKTIIELDYENLALSQFNAIINMTDEELALFEVDE